MPIGSVLALAWANTSDDSYFRFVLSWSFAVNGVGMTLFFALVTQEIVEATLPGGALGAMAADAAAGGRGDGRTLRMRFSSISATCKYMDEVMLSQAWPCAGAVDLVFSYFLAKVIFRRGAGVAFTLLLAIASDIVVLALCDRSSIRPGSPRRGRPDRRRPFAGGPVSAQPRLRTFWAYLLIPRLDMLVGIL